MITSFANSQRLLFFTGSGFVLILLGLIGILGQLPIIYYPLMPWENAIALVCLGAAVVLLTCGYRRYSQYCAMVVFFITSLVVIEKGLLSYDGGIYSGGVGSTLAREVVFSMSLMTAICLYCGLACYLILSFRVNIITSFIFEFLSSIIITFSLISVFGYLTGILPETVQSKIHYMQVSTALGFLVFGILFFGGAIASALNDNTFGLGTAVAIGLIFVLLTLGLWHTLRLQEIMHVNSNLDQGSIGILGGPISKLVLLFGLIKSLMAMLCTYFAFLLIRKNIDLEHLVTALEVSRQEAEKANKAKSMFLANMSHEIRTPLNGIVGTTALLGESSLDQVQTRYSKRISVCCSTLLNLVNDVLDISKIEAGEMKLDKSSFNLQQVVRDVSNMIVGKMEEKGLELIVYDRHQLDFQVIADSHRIKQVLQNLLSNAIKFTEHGCIIVKIEVVNQTPTLVEIKFSVKDTGIGINRDKYDLLFRNFSQVDSSITRKFGGTGLGLAISKQLVEMMGGKIGVESEEGQGSTFWFTLPLEIDQTKPLEVHQCREELTRLAGKSALIVDDNQINCDVLYDYLVKVHVRAKFVLSAEQALTQILTQPDPFDVILIDYNMPLMNGLQLVQKIRSLPHGGDSVLILLSSIEVQLEGADIDGSIIKPIYPQELYNLIKNSLEDKFSTKPTQV